MVERKIVSEVVNKNCLKCKEDKENSLTFFVKTRQGEIGNVCKLCRHTRRTELRRSDLDKHAKIAKEWRLNNRWYFIEYYSKNKERLSQKGKVYYKTNAEKLKDTHKNQYESNKEKRLAKTKEYQLKNPDKYIKYAKISKDRNREKNNEKRRSPAYRAAINKYVKVKRETNTDFKIQSSLRDRFNKAVKKSYKSGSAVRDLGCSIRELKMYLEAKFQPGMTWEKHGIHGWHIDHIKPLASFNLSYREQFLQACHYTNLQPLWARDNLSKGSKLETLN